MQMYVMVVGDRATDSFLAPYVALNINGAKRDFANAINDKDDRTNRFAKNPEDFDLYHLGLYDDSTAKFELFDRPRQVAIGKDLVR